MLTVLNSVNLMWNRRVPRALHLESAADSSLAGRAPRRGELGSCRFTRRSILRTLSGF